MSWYLGGHFVSRCTPIKESPMCQITLRLCNSGAGVRMDGFKLEGGELFKEDFRKLLKQE